MPTLNWLPIVADWGERLQALPAHATPWMEAVALANARLDHIATNRLDRAVRRLFPEPPPGLATRPVRLALLGSCGVAHLEAALRVGGLRRGLHVSTCAAAYGQYVQDLTDPRCALRAFRPDAVLIALDAHHLTAGVTARLGAAEADAAQDEILARIRNTWQLAADAFGCAILQQTILPLFPALLGSNEHRLAGSRAAFVARLNARLPALADAAGVDLVAIAARAAQDGIAQWHNPVLWHYAKQEIAAAAAPMYGDLVGRMLAAAQGRSARCLVLDLDGTLWGGVVGDDGPEGIVLGQGSALGEAYVAFQQYCHELADRGVILAVCSKNNEAGALEPFARHPEMVLRRDDIASFVANWSDKPANLRRIADELGLGLDALVFVDDNPFERELVRQALPMVAVPEIGEEPAAYAQAISDAGYFEALALTQEDRIRSERYRSDGARQMLRVEATNLDDYLAGLRMQLVWCRFDRMGLSRIVQLINKSNQFNLTTRRYAETDVLAVMRDPAAFGLQFRLQDRFGDHGIISVVIGRLQEDDTVFIDTWLMSCRVLGRRVEAAALGVVAAAARELGARRLVGEYIPTARNAIVKDHYPQLGFAGEDADAGGSRRFVLDLAGFTPAATFVEVGEGT